VETPPSFMAVGQFYASFTQVSDDEAMRYLD
jgi:predicted phosphoribosyltransferase